MVALQREQLVLDNESEYGNIRWISPAQAAAAEAERSILIADLKGLESCRGTKFSSGELSPGCRACVDGAWSCLFINGKCNCRCFYCPTPQDEIGLPTTNTVTFERAGDYVDYVEAFGFRGVSFSGGEPLITFEKTLSYLKAVKNRLDVHTWLYTNGSLLTAEKVELLRAAGLDELRFDIGATNYSLKAVALAVGQIPTVTVEIPAVPEEFELLKTRMVELRDLGVNHLNLHQLRLTPHNFSQLTKRPYTFLHGEKVSVLESELTALKLVRHGLQIGLPVNYCSFVYKYRFQRQAARRRNAALMRKPHEVITGSGHLRGIALTGANLERQAGRLAGAENWSLAGERLWLAPELLGLVEAESLRIEYGDCFIMPALSYQHPFREVRINGGCKLFVEKQQTGFSLTERAEIAAMLAGDPPLRLSPFEEVVPGLQDYF